MKIVLVTLYLVLILVNLILYLNNKVSKPVVYITFILLFFLMSGHRYAGNGDSGDFLAYWYGYTYYDYLNQENFGLYYLFFLLEKLGLLCSLDFYQWRAVMTFLSLLAILRAFHKYAVNPHIFIFFFMAYYVFMLYGGLKLYYGLCIYLLGFGYLFSGKLKDKLKYAIFTCLAGGMHAMYYLFLIFIIIQSNSRGLYLKLLGALALVFSVIEVIFGKQMLFLQSIASSLDSDKVMDILSMRTNNGYLICIGMQLLSLFYAWEYRKIARLRLPGQGEADMANTVFYANLLEIFFYPLFMITTTFLRLVTVLSPITILMSGHDNRQFVHKDRLALVGCGLLVLCGYYYYNLVIGNYWQYTFVPFFDCFYFQ